MGMVLALVSSYYLLIAFAVGLAAGVVFLVTGIIIFVRSNSDKPRDYGRFFFSSFKFTIAIIISAIIIFVMSIEAAIEFNFVGAMIATGFAAASPGIGTLLAARNKKQLCRKDGSA